MPLAGKDEREDRVGQIRQRQRRGRETWASSTIVGMSAMSVRCVRFRRPERGAPTTQVSKGKGSAIPAQVAESAKVAKTQAGRAGFRETEVEAAIPNETSWKRAGRAKTSSLARGGGGLPGFFF